MPVIVTGQLKNLNEKELDLDYWLAQPVAERLKGVTFIVSQSLKDGQRMNKSIIIYRYRKPSRSK